MNECKRNGPSKHNHMHAYVYIYMNARVEIFAHLLAYIKKK